IVRIVYGDTFRHQSARQVGLRFVIPSHQTAQMTEIPCQGAHANATDPYEVYLPDVCDVHTSVIVLTIFQLTLTLPGRSHRPHPEYPSPLRSRITFRLAAEHAVSPARCLSVSAELPHRIPSVLRFYLPMPVHF